MKTDFINGTATFVMPHWRTDNEKSRVHLEEAVQGILNQTDQNFRIVIIDDCSPCREAVEYLKKLKDKYPDKIHIILKETNEGPGVARNIGIKWAYDNDSPIVLFNDSDDISNNRRLEVVRKTFVEDAEANVVYSTFKVIDENSVPVADEKLSPAIYETLEGHKKNIVQGKNAWIAIATEKNYTNLTSSTAVKTKVAYKYPFPAVKASEDAHTWLRYAAHKGTFVYCADIPSLYRIPQNTACSTRARIGNFYEIKAAVDTDGFKEAMRIAIENGSIDPVEKDNLLIRFYIKLAESLSKGDQYELASIHIEKAVQISREKTKEIIHEKNLQNCAWARV